MSTLRVTIRQKILVAMDVADVEGKYNAADRIAAEIILAMHAPPLAADEIVERATAQQRRETRIVLYLAVVAAVFLSGYLNREWIRSHPEFFLVVFGVFIGSTVQGIAWGRWRWNKGDRP